MFRFVIALLGVACRFSFPDVVGCSFALRIVADARHLHVGRRERRHCGDGEWSAMYLILREKCVQCQTMSTALVFINVAAEGSGGSSVPRDLRSSRSYRVLKHQICEQPRQADVSILYIPVHFSVVFLDDQQRQIKNCLVVFQTTTFMLYIQKIVRCALAGISDKIDTINQAVHPTLEICYINRRKRP